MAGSKKNRMFKDIPDTIRIDNKKFTLYFKGAKSIVERKKQELIDYNRTERGRMPKGMRSTYRYRVVHYGDKAAIYTN
jgi:hypothetical protein